MIKILTTELKMWRHRRDLCRQSSRVIGGGANDSGSVIRAEFLGSQFPDRQESGGAVTPASKISAVIR